MSTKQAVLITGCSSGFGYRLALKFARNGFTTFASLRDLKSGGAMELQRIASKENLPLEIIEIDISRAESVEKGIEYINKKEGKIDVLVNNAGWGYIGPIEEYSIDEAIEQYQTNVFGMLRMIKEVSPLMRKNKKGIIINLSSINGLIPFPMMGFYSSSKYAIESLTEILRFELSHFGIKVTQIEPGSFLTEGNARNLKRSKKSYLDNSIYRPLTERFMKNLNAAREKAMHNRLWRYFLDPQRVVDLIFDISQTENPKMRYRIGIDAQLYYFAKKVLPEGLWEWMLHRVYKW